MAKLERFDYTGKDFAQIVNEVIGYLKTEYPDRWTDFEHDNAGQMLIEAFAYICDMLLFYLDRQANECFLPTAKERQKIINLCKLIGYTVSPASPAQADVVFSLPNAQEKRVTVPSGTALTTAEKVRFELDHDVVIAPGELSAMGSCTEGQTYDVTVGMGNGEAGQEVTLPQKGVISVQAVLVDGEVWERIDSFALSNPTGKHYMIDVDALGRAKLSFGDGRLGRIPRNGAAIKAQYRIGGGVNGNVAANTIIRMPLAAVDETGQTVVVNVTNPESAAGGMEEESIDHIRTWAPSNFSVQGRLVTEADYNAVANSFSSEQAGRFAKVSAIVHERSGEANVIRLYALAQGADGELVAPPQGLIDAFLAYIDDIKMLTDYVDVVPATTRRVDIAAEVALTPGFLADTVLSEIWINLKEFMNPSHREMGEALRYSDLYRVMDATRGVDWVEITEPSGTVTAEGKQELLVLGEVTLKAVSIDGA